METREFVCIVVLSAMAGLTIGMAVGAAIEKSQIMESLRHFPNFFIKDYLRHFGTRKDKARHRDDDEPGVPELTSEMLEI